MVSVPGPRGRSRDALRTLRGPARAVLRLILTEMTGSLGCSSPGPPRHLPWNSPGGGGGGGGYHANGLSSYLGKVRRWLFSPGPGGTLDAATSIGDIPDTVRPAPDAMSGPPEPTDRKGA